MSNECRQVDNATAIVFSFRVYWTFLANSSPLPAGEERAPPSRRLRPRSRANSTGNLVRESGRARPAAIPAVKDAIARGKPLVADIGDHFETLPLGGVGSPLSRPR